MEYIQLNPPGIVIYLWQEGRGIGLANKIAAYKLQEQGLDTVDANRALGLPDDLREYTSVRNILREMGIKSVRLMTNNPRKTRLLTELGVKVTDRIPIQIKAGDHNKVCFKGGVKGVRTGCDRPQRGLGPRARSKEAAAVGGAGGSRRLSAGLCPQATPLGPRLARPCGPLSWPVATGVLSATPLSHVCAWHYTAQGYLEAKTKRMDHIIDQVYWSGAPPLEAQGALSVHPNSKHAPTSSSVAASGSNGSGVEAT
jgi:hypothetical protein